MTSQYFGLKKSRKLRDVRLGPYFEDPKLSPVPTFPQNLGPIRGQIPGKLKVKGDMSLVMKMQKYF